MMRRMILAGRLVPGAGDGMPALPPHPGKAGPVEQLVEVSICRKADCTSVLTDLQVFLPTAGLFAA